MLYINSQGERVETTVENAATVRFFRQGGGFEQRLPAATFHQMFKPAPPPTWRAGTVTAEWLPDKVYQCWSNGEVWNGFGQPFFDAATINVLIHDLRKAGMTKKVEWVGDQLMYTDTDEDETYEIAPISVPGYLGLLYGLGAGNWTWDAVVFDEDTQKLRRRLVEALAHIEDNAVRLRGVVEAEQGEPLSRNRIAAYRKTAEAMLSHFGDFGQLLDQLET